MPANRLPNADEYQVKAALIVQLKRLMAEREITQTEAAKLVGVKQPNISKLLRGQFKLVSWKSCCACWRRSIRTAK
ncbi:XRE family transcriptional regulator [Bradyrhizobium sp. USDA 3650]